MSTLSFSNFNPHPNIQPSPYPDQRLMGFEEVFNSLNRAQGVGDREEVTFRFSLLTDPHLTRSIKHTRNKRTRKLVITYAPEYDAPNELRPAHCRLQDSKSWHTLGYITYNGEFKPTKELRERTQYYRRAVWEILKRLRQDTPSAVKELGQEMGVCACCGRTLTDPVSVRNGIGPVCAKNFGLPYLEEGVEALDLSDF